jgi:hypothetical protein
MPPLPLPLLLPHLRPYFRLLLLLPPLLSLEPLPLHLPLLL